MSDAIKRIVNTTIFTILFIALEIVIYILNQTHFKCQLKARQPSDTYSSDSHHINGQFLEGYQAVIRELDSHCH